MPKKISRKSFLLRIDKNVFRAVQRWAIDEQRSLNGQIVWVLRAALSGSAGKRRHHNIPASKKPGTD